MRDEILNLSRICDIPQTFCATDGSHIKIKAPLECKEDFFNRKKKYYSIVLQGVVNADMKFIDVSTGYTLGAYMMPEF